MNQNNSTPAFMDRVGFWGGDGWNEGTFVCRQGLNGLVHWDTMFEGSHFSVEALDVLEVVTKKVAS